MLKDGSKCRAERKDGRERDAGCWASHQAHMLGGYEDYILQSSFIKALGAQYVLSKCSSYSAKADRFIPFKFRKRFEVPSGLASAGFKSNRTDR